MTRIARPDEGGAVEVTAVLQQVPDASPPLYVPFRHGRYDVAPGLAKFSKAAGGGVDAQVFQIDREFGAFRRAKLASRGEGVATYYGTSGVGEVVAQEVARFVLGRLAVEHPQWFGEERDGAGVRLRCGLTGETLSFDARLRLVGVTGSNAVPPYVDALDALACQVQEDLAVVNTSAGRHWLSAAHVCLPNGWAPAEKVGQSFAGMHEPVAGMAAMNRRGDEFAAVMVRAAAGLVRFAWGLTFDAELNHHPNRPPAAFDPADPRAFVRVERQTIWGLPHVGAAVFTIRTYVYNAQGFRRDAVLREALVAALRSMSAESRAYKGLAQRFDALVGWIASSGENFAR